MRSEIDDTRLPKGIAIIGSDDSAEAFFMLTFDTRKVSRKYEVTLRDNIWKWWRNDPTFSQRFEATIGDDGNTIISKGEMAKEGSPWEKDLELTYKRVR